MTREDFYPSYARTAAIYANEFPPGSTKPWPREKSPQEKRIEDLYKLVVDPSTQEYYKSKDGQPPRKYVNQIVRFRTLERKEYLYSNGYVRFYEMFGDSVIEVCNKQEAYEHPNFSHQTQIDPRDGHLKRFTVGIEDKTMKYDLDWTAENIDKLLELESPTGCALDLMDERIMTAKGCPTLEMFKTKSFDYIYKDEYKTLEEREVALKEHEALTGSSSPRKKS